MKIAQHTKSRNVMAMFNAQSFDNGAEEQQKPRNVKHTNRSLKRHRMAARAAKRGYITA
jgi:hypothetical protein